MCTDGDLKKQITVTAKNNGSLFFAALSMELPNSEESLKTTGTSHTRVSE